MALCFKNHHQYQHEYQTKNKCKHKVIGIGMTFIITTIAGMAAVVSGALFSYGHKDASLVALVFTLLLSLAAIVSRLKENSPRTHIEEQKILLNSAIDIIDARTRLTTESVASFRGEVKKYRYALPEEQKEFISHLLSAAGDVRINDTELRSDILTKEERKKLISSNRGLINKIEKSRLVIEKYLSK